VFETSNKLNKILLKQPNPLNSKVKGFKVSQCGSHRLAYYRL